MGCEILAGSHGLVFSHVLVWRVLAYRLAGCGRVQKVSSLESSEKGVPVRSLFKKEPLSCLWRRVSLPVTSGNSSCFNWFNWARGRSGSTIKGCKRLIRAWRRGGQQQGIHFVGCREHPDDGQLCLCKRGFGRVQGAWIVIEQYVCTYVCQMYV